MAFCVFQYKALVLMILMIGASIGASAEEESNGISYWKVAGCGGAAAVAVAATPYVLAAAGFTSAGVAAGSLAAWTQGYIYGNVAAGSVFAGLQSVGVTGVGYGGGAMISATVRTLCGLASSSGD